MNAPCKLGLFLIAITLLAPIPRAFAQDESNPAARKLMKSPKPDYPALARKINLSGTVRLEALVEPNGSVKAVEVKGGNALLAQSAQFAVREWKWAKSAHETTEILEIRFVP
jgi:TonB family protein